MRMNKKGITLVECIMAIAVISIISAVAVVIYRTSLRSTNKQWDNYLTTVMADNALACFQNANDLATFEENLDGLTQVGNDATQYFDIKVSESVREMNLSTQSAIPASFDKIRTYDTGVVSVISGSDTLAEFNYGGKTSQFTADTALLTKSDGMYSASSAPAKKTLTVNASGGGKSSVPVCQTSYQFVITEEQVALYFRGSVYSGKQATTRDTKNITYDTTPIEKYYLKNNRFLVPNTKSYKETVKIRVNSKYTNYCLFVFAVFEMSDDGVVSQAKNASGKYIYVCAVAEKPSSAPTDWLNDSTGYKIVRVYEGYSATSFCSNEGNTSGDMNVYENGSYVVKYGRQINTTADVFSCFMKSTSTTSFTSFSKCFNASGVTEITSSVTSADFTWKYIPALVALKNGQSYYLPQFILNTNFYNNESLWSTRTNFLVYKHSSDNFSDFPKGAPGVSSKAEYTDYVLKSGVSVPSQIYCALAKTGEIQLCGSADTLLYDFHGDITNPLAQIKSKCGFQTGVAADGGFTKWWSVTAGIRLTKVIQNTAASAIEFYDGSKKVIWFDYANSTDYSDACAALLTQYGTNYDGDGNIKTATTGDMLVRYNDSGLYEVLVRNGATDTVVFSTDKGVLRTQLNDESMSFERAVGGTSTIQGTAITRCYQYVPNDGDMACFIRVTFANAISVDTTNSVEPRIRIWIIPRDKLPKNSSDMPTTSAYISYRKG